MEPTRYKVVWYNGGYYIYYRKPVITGEGVKSEPKRISLRTRDSEVAEQRFIAWKLEKNKTSETTVLEAWLQYSEERGKERSAYASKQFLPFFGKIDTNDVSVELCRLYVAKRHEDGVQNATIRRELSIMRAALNYAAKPGHRDYKFELPPAPPPKDRSLTKEEFFRLREEVQQTKHLALFLELALATAARKTAILELTWDRVDFERRQINLRNPERLGDRNKPRARVPMTNRLYDELQKAFKDRTSNYVVEWAGDGVQDVRHSFAKAAKRANTIDVTPHVLRHTSAVWMAEAGVPMSEIAQYLGHTNTRITESTYARYSPEYLKGAARALDV